MFAEPAFRSACPLQASRASGEDAAILLAYCARTLTAVQQEALERHIAVCEDCRYFAEAQQLLWTSLDAWQRQWRDDLLTTNSLQKEDEWRRRLLDKVDREECRGASSTWWHGISWKPAVPVCATAAAFAMLILNPSVEPPQPIAAPTLQAEQAERLLEDLALLGQFRPPQR